MGCASSHSTMVVAVPLADLRAAPHTTVQTGTHDPQQETQLLYGEQVRVVESREGWSRVEALEQAEYSHQGRWQGYPGWVPAQALAPSDAVSTATAVVTSRWARVWADAYRTAPLPMRLPLGTMIRATEMGGQLWRVELVDGGFAWMAYAEARSLQELAVLPPLERRTLVLRIAALFLGDPYVWGGRSPRTDETAIAASGVDCSGLVNLAYRAAGMAIPRDAHEQSLRAQPVKAPQPGDLIFLSERGNPRHVVHVMLYAGDGDVIEAPGTGQTVRRIPLARRLGQPLDWLAPGSVVDGQTVSFGSYLP
ncbi:MAG: C40 family peptidase [Candidatus Omnitrophica bacterium]|nr:C40 family peptidase [Candidatus Omnitrophota bacterium]